LFYKKKRSKYNNTKCTADDFKFDSLKEKKRYHELKLLEQHGRIDKLEIHPKWTFKDAWIAGDKLKRQASYTADFSYFIGTEFIVEDVKSPFTAKDKYFKLKRAFFERDFGLKITIVY